MLVGAERANPVGTSPWPTGCPSTGGTAVAVSAGPLTSGPAWASGCGGRVGGVVFRAKPIMPAPSMAMVGTTAAPAARHGLP